MIKLIIYLEEEIWIDIYRINQKLIRLKFRIREDNFKNFDNLNNTGNRIF